MDEITRSNIRDIFPSPRPMFAFRRAASVLGIPFQRLKQEIADGSIVAVSTRLARRIPREEMIAAAIRVYDQATLEEALDDAARMLPEAVRLVELRARVPRYQRDVLRVLADQQGTTVDAVLAREIEDLACAHAEELAAVPGLRAALAWPESGDTLRPAS